MEVPQGSPISTLLIFNHRSWDSIHPSLEAFGPQEPAEVAFVRALEALLGPVLALSAKLLA